MKAKFEMKAIQLDLARQMETVTFIKEYIDFIAENHYNTLFLYLEWRIRTKTFDIGKDAGYSAAQIREIVDYADLRGITVIPGLATLGHADLLLPLKKYAQFAEIKNGITGRFGAVKAADLCPSDPAVLEFLDAYLTDVAEIFDHTPYFHIGGDEDFNIGYCPECKKKAVDYLHEEYIYRDHILFLHQLTQKLGKRMMMWDDMFEIYPDILKDLPRDIIMVNWLYRDNVPGFVGHFCNQVFEDWLGRYDELGFDYLIAPADYTWCGTETFTGYASAHKTFGGLLTSWEKAPSLMFKYFPNIAMAGQLWGQAAPDGESAMMLGLKQLFGKQDEVFMHAVAAYGNQARRIGTASLADMTAFDFKGPDHAACNALQTITEVLLQYPGRMRDTRGETILNDIIGDCVLKLLKMRCADAGWKYFHHQPHEDFRTLREEVVDAGKKYAEFYLQHRRPCDLKSFDKKLNIWLAALDEMIAADEKGVLKVLFALPDYHAAERTRISVNGKEVAFRCFKAEEVPFYEFNFFLPKDETVKEIRFEAVGYGGQGIAYVSAETGKGKFIPAAVTQVAGIVEHPEFILENDVTYAYLGTYKVMDAFYDRSLSTMVSSLTISMKKVK